jgi:hypothetical protein
VAAGVIVEFCETRRAADFGSVVIPASGEKERTETPVGRCDAREIDWNIHGLSTGWELWFSKLKVKMVRAVAVILPSESVSGLSPCTDIGSVDRGFSEPFIAVKFDELAGNASPVSYALAKPKMSAIHGNTRTIHVSASQFELGQCLFENFFADFRRW